MEQLSLGLSSVEVKSFTNPDVTYIVDVEARTCTCPAFKKFKGPCKHIQSILGESILESNVTMPDIKMAMSCLIKCVRLRKLHESAYWLNYLWVMFPNERWRVCRRVLILAGEDCISIPTQTSVADWYRHGSGNSSYRRALVELIRIIKTPNWWALEDGAAYFHHWNEAYTRTSKLKPYDGVAAGVLRERLIAAIHGKDTLEAFSIHAEIYGRKREKVKYCTFLLGIAEDLRNVQAIKILKMVLANVKGLYGDDNYEGQAIWWLCGNSFPEQYCPTPEPNEIESSEQFVAEHTPMDRKLPVPAWCCDGVHTSGSDRRFGGIVKSMLGCCRAFKHFGRLDPSDTWLHEFWR